MATAKELSLVNTLISEGVTETGRPSFLKGWTPISFLGKGNFGEVFEIRRGGERCALKIVAMDDDFIDQYAAEIDALNRIRDEKHAVRIEEYEILGVDRGAYIQRYMIIRMGLLNKLPESMDEDSVIMLGLDMCDILAKCHSGTPKILHCDIKPENILVSPDGSYMLSDFGAARISDKTHNSSGFRGTPMYMSPEMHDYKGYDARSDLYSLGVTMYTLLNGGLQPFSDGTNNAQAIRMRFDGKKLPDIPGASTGIMKILRRLCAADPNKRYRSAQELSSDLSTLASAREKAAREEQRRREEQQRKREEEQRRREEEKAAAKKLAEQKAARSGDSVYSNTVMPGHRPVPSAAEQPRKKPLGIVATAAALVAAIVCGVIFIPGLSKKNDDNASQPAGAVSGAVSVSDINIKAELPNVSASDVNTAADCRLLSDITDISDISVGDHVLFGSYPQTEYGVEQPVEWRVLNIEDGKILMLSEYLLDAHRFDDNSNDWAKSELRKWLNDEFLNRVFDDAEQQKLNSIAISDKDKDKDKVSLLTDEEVKEYIPDFNNRKTVPTAYAEKQIRASEWVNIDEDEESIKMTLEMINDSIKEFGGWCWWLRSPCENNDPYGGDIVAYVTYDGSIDRETGYVNCDWNCVRPVILVSFTAESDKPKNDQGTTAANDQGKTTAQQTTTTCAPEQPVPAMPAEDYNKPDSDEDP